MISSIPSRSWKSLTLKINFQQAGGVGASPPPVGPMVKPSRGGPVFTNSPETFEKAGDFNSFL